MMWKIVTEGLNSRELKESHPSLKSAREKVHKLNRRARERGRSVRYVAQPDYTRKKRTGINGLQPCKEGEERKPDPQWQAEDRCRRRGIKTNVLVTDIIAPKAIDTELRNRVKAKRDKAEGVNGLQPCKEGDE